METFYQHRHLSLDKIQMNIQKFCLFVIFVSAAMLGVI